MAVYMNNNVSGFYSVGIVDKDGSVVEAQIKTHTMEPERDVSTITYSAVDLPTSFTFVIEGEQARQLIWFFSPMRQWMRKLAEYNAKKESAN